MDFRISDWRQWAGIDLRSMALFRVLFAGVLFVDSLRSLSNARLFYSDGGVLPRAALIEADSWTRVSWHLANGDPLFASALILATSLLALALLIGWRTRLVTILLFVLVGSLQNRNPLVLIGGDSLIMCLLFWSLFLPLGARFSVDAALSTKPPPRESLHASLASLGMLLQVLSVYFFSAILKDASDWWPDGLAVYYTLELERYATPLGRSLLAFPALLQWLSWFVYFLEWLAPVAVFSPVFLSPLRTTAMVLLMLMHLGFIACLELGHFPYVSLCSLTLLLSRRTWDRLARWRPAYPVQIYFDRDCGFCRRSCQLLRTFLVLGEAPIRPAQDHPRADALVQREFSWVVIDHEDQAHLRWAAFVALLQASPLWRPLALLLALPVWNAPGDAVYRWVAHHRGAVAQASAWLMPERAVGFELGRAGQAIAGLAAAILLAWNLASVQGLPTTVTDTLRPGLRLLRLDQFWNMFAPFPTRVDGWLLVPGELEDGNQIDVLQPRQALSWDKPDSLSARHEHVRWHTYRWRLWEDEYAQYRKHYARFLCREYNRTAPAGKRLLQLQLIWMLELTREPGVAAVQRRDVGWSHNCVSPELIERIRAARNSSSQATTE